MGHPAVHHGAEGAVGVQREPLHLHDHLQRVSALNLPQRLHVSTELAVHQLYLC